MLLYFTGGLVILLSWHKIFVGEIEKIIESFMKAPKDMASFVYGIRNEVIALGLDFIKRH